MAGVPCGMHAHTAALCAGKLQVVLEEGDQQIPVTIHGLSPSGYLLVRAGHHLGSLRCQSAGTTAPSQTACCHAMSLSLNQQWSSRRRPPMGRASVMSCTPTGTASTSFAGWSAASCRSEQLRDMEMQ